MRQTAFASAARTACFAVLGLGAALAAAALGRVARAEDPIDPQPETRSDTHPETEAELEALRQALAAHAEEARRLDHAFRTPIGAAAAALQLLETSGDDPELQTQARQVIARQLSRMTALTESLREAAQRLSREA
jgi:signal transduction histidine kinase